MMGAAITSVPIPKLLMLPQNEGGSNMPYCQLPRMLAPSESRVSDAAVFSALASPKLRNGQGTTLRRLIKIGKTGINLPISLIYSHMAVERNKVNEIGLFTLSMIRYAVVLAK